MAAPPVVVPAQPETFIGSTGLVHVWQCQNDIYLTPTARPQALMPGDQRLILQRSGQQNCVLYTEEYSAAMGGGLGGGPYAGRNDAVAH